MDTPQGIADLPIAVIGMACRLPGARNLEQFWQLLLSGQSAVAEVPPDRFDQDLYYDPRQGIPAKSYTKIGALLDNREFDREACPLPDELVRSADHTHLLMCEVAAAACRQAGLDPFQLPLRNTGVYVGHAQGSTLAGDYIYHTCVEEAAQLLGNLKELATLSPADRAAVADELVARVRAGLPERTADSPDVSTHMVAGLVSKAFGLTGPYLALNAACASSPQALLLAARALQLGRIDMAIVGGASDCKSDTLTLFSAAQSMSATGTRPFDSEADGLVCGEGYVALVLKTLPRAIADGDPIQAVIRGLGISSDGHGKSLWAPRKEGQVEAMQRVYRGTLDPAGLQYIEAHATSTSLGDATELSALSEVLAPRVAPGQKIALGSVKANVGHTLECAGLTSVCKTILSLQHRTIPGAINVRELNKKIDWQESPFYVPMTATAWPDPQPGQPRRAAVNSFGIGGLNMHIVLEEWAGAPPNAFPPAPAHDNEAGAVAVIGMGCILPGAQGAEQLWQLLESGRDARTAAPADRWSDSPTARRLPTRLGGFITDFQYDWRRHKVPPKQVAQADPMQFMLLEAADQALKHAGYDKRPLDKKRAGVLVGTEFGGDFSTQLTLGLRLPHLQKVLGELLAQRGIGPQQIEEAREAFAKALLARWPALIDETGSFSTSTLASRITKTLDLMGGAAAVDSGDTSAMTALAGSIDLLLAGDCDVMFCAAGQRRMAVPTYEALSLAGVLATGDAPASPLDVQASGFVPGEGVGVVMLKRLADARRDGDRIHAIIRGTRAARADSCREALTLAMQRSFAATAVQPQDLALLEVDGHGLAPEDKELAAAARDVLGRSRTAPLVVGTAVGQIGHTSGASGMVSLLKASLEIEKGTAAPVAGLQSPLPELRSQPFDLPRQAQAIRHATADGRRLAGVVSQGKGLAFHVVLERGERVPADQVTPPQQPQAGRLSAAVPPPDMMFAPMSLQLPPDTQANGRHVSTTTRRIYRLGAASAQELASRLAAVRCQPAEWMAADRTFTPHETVRLAIVAESSDSLAQKLELAERQLANPAARLVLEQQGVYFRQVAAELPRIAFVFSGQGSQYAGMLRELVAASPAARAAMQELDAAMQRAGEPTFAQLAWDDAERLGSDIWRTQIAMLLGDLIVYAALRERGIVPDLVTGHSFGEIAALTAAGAWSLDAAIKIVKARAAGVSSGGQRGALLATSAPRERVEELARAASQPLYVANHNAPDQTVVGGSREALEQFKALLEVHSFKAQLLSVPAAFHTPLMLGSSGGLETALYSTTVRPPRMPLLSSVTGRYEADPESIRENLARQLTRPVEWVALMRRLAGEGPVVLVEVGPQQALTKLNRRILQDREVAGIIAADNPARPGAEQLDCVQALLECLGAVPGSRWTTPAVINLASATSAADASASRGRIVHFDATEARRDKMRQAAKSEPLATQPAPPPVADLPAVPAGPTVSPAAEDRVARVLTPTPKAKDNGHARVPEPPRAPAPVHSAVDPSQLESFLVNFVVEQTGYPPDVVDLDADLEADLGIDSIKKAQMFGELQEYFPDVVQPREDLTLDDFPTLRHVLNFLRDESAKAAPVDPPAPPVLATSAIEAPVVLAPARPLVDPSQLESFLVNFVVEQTGYPPDVVDLDADLEADLGIDSIKKAQMFGELQEYFPDVVQPREDLTLDDFPTLRHVLNFLRAESAQESVPAAAPAVMPEPSPALVAVAEPAARMAIEPSQLEAFLVNFVVEQTGYPPDVVDLDADLEADLGIDSIKKAQMFGELQEYFPDVVQPREDLTLDDFPTLRHVLDFLRAESPAQTQQPPAAEPLPAVEASQPEPKIEAVTAAPIGQTQIQPAELESFLVNFVVEQTGYPPDVVDLDADLEADLGIDSIKKAQMFGELQEYFPDVVQPREDLTLDDFPTLRHVLNFLRTESRSEEPVAEPLAADDYASGDHEGELEGSAELVLRLSGTRYEMGLAHGRELQTSIRRVLRYYADLAGEELEELPLAGALRDDPSKLFTADELDELRGIADGAGVPFGNIVAHNVALLADLGASSTQLVVPGGRSAETLHALEDPLPLAAGLREELVPVVQVREAAGDVPHAVCSFAGLMFGVSGLNAYGLAVSSGSLAGRSTGTAGGRFPALLVGEILESASDLDSAVEIARQFTSLVPWNACISDSTTGRARYLEHDGRALDVREPVEAVVASSESHQYNGGRLQRVSDMLGESSELSTASGVRRALTRCRLNGHGSNGNGNSPVAVEVAESHDPALHVIMQPSAQRMWLGGVGGANGSLLGVRVESLGERQHGNGAAGDANLKKKDRNPPEHRRPVEQPQRSEPPAPALTGAETCRRYAMRMVRWPLPHNTPRLPQWAGPAIILGDNAVARALEREIASSGGRVHRLPVGVPLEETLEALERLWSEAPAPHLFLLTGSDAEAMDPRDEAAWQGRRTAAIEMPFFVCQRFVQLVRDANLLSRATIVATTSLGGDFGFSGNIASVEGGWLTGLMKSLFIEIVRMGKQSDFLVKAIDAPADEPPALLAASICRELAGKTDDFEVAYGEGRRYLQYAHPIDVTPVDASGVRDGGVWVVTGGARGITAACALELGRRFGLKLHLIGATRRPEIDPAWLAFDEAALSQLRSSTMRAAYERGESPPEAWRRLERGIEIARSLQSFAAAGIEATYHACDVADRAALAQVLDRVREQDGPIDGLLHGAGIDIAKRFEKKERSAVMATFAAKVQGAANLMVLTQNDPIRHFVGFGSVSGRLGSNGQTDYAAASDMLCKLAAWYGRSRPDCHAIGFHWAPWDEVGMASRPENRIALKVKDAPKLMPKEEGIRHLVRELYDLQRTSEVLVIDPTYYKLFYNKGEPPAVADEHAPDIALASSSAAPVDLASDSKLTERYVLRLFDSPLPDAEQSIGDVSGAVYIVGDNAIARGLTDRLGAAGHSVVRIDTDGSTDAAIARLEAAWSEQPGNYLLLATACDPEAAHLFEPGQWQARIGRGVLTPYLLAQRWWQLWLRWAGRQKATIAAVTRMGGDFGLGGNCVAPEGGALAGTLKSLFIEDFRSLAGALRVRVIDVRPDAEPADVAAWTCAELAADSRDLEVGWIDGRRFALRPVREDAPLGGDSLRSPGKDPNHAIERGGVWIVTGGACGISAATALELGRRYGLKLHLLGRSPAPRADAPWRDKTDAELETLKAQIVAEASKNGQSPIRAWERVRRDIEIWNNLQRFAAADMVATYHACDVSDREALAAVLDRVRRHDGPIAGVLHGAGTNNPARFERKRREVVEEMIGAKVGGAWNLMLLTRQDPVRCFIGFGSVTGRFGGNGMTDYAAVNDMLCKLIAWYRGQRPDCHAVAFDWESWGEVGMAVAPRHVMAGVQGKLEFMPPREGIEHILCELAAGAPEAEVLFTRDRFLAERYPHVQAARSTEIAPLGLPLIDRVEEVNGSCIAYATLDPVADPFLKEHRLRDKPLMPAVVGLELLAEAAVVNAPAQGVVALRDIEIVDGLSFSTSRPLTPRVSVERIGGGRFRASVTCDFVSRSGKLIQANRPYLHGTVELAASRASLSGRCPPAPKHWHAFQYEDAHLIYHGACLRGVTQTTFDATEGWAKLIALPLQGLAGRRPAANWIAPSTLLDAAFYACGIHVWFHGGQAISLPRGLRELRLGRSMRSHERCLVRFTCQALEADSAEYDFTIYGEDGEAIVEALGYRKVLLRQRGGK